MSAPNSTDVIKMPTPLQGLLLCRDVTRESEYDSVSQLRKDYSLVKSRVKMSEANVTAFCSPLCFPLQRVGFSVSARPHVTMRTGKRKVGPKGPSGFSSEKEDRLKETARRFGIKAPRVGDDFDSKYNTPPSPSDKRPPPTLYQMLAGTFGVEVLEAGEKVVYVALGIMLVAFLGSGLAISSEAFFKASGKEVSEGLDAVLTKLEGAFTPILVGFVALSSFLGLYKQSQLTSGASAYSALKDKDRD